MAAKMANSKKMNETYKYRVTGEVNLIHTSYHPFNTPTVRYLPYFLKKKLAPLFIKCIC